jgi:nuclease S1
MLTMPHLRTVRAFSLAMAILLVAVSPLWSWGREGHRIVARIAVRNLKPEARKKLAAILGTNDAGLEEAMAAASTWPDEINKSKTGTFYWHFVDVPVNAPFALGTLCAKHDCIIDRIQEMTDRLRMNQFGFTLAAPPEPPRPPTSQQVAFLIHFVGDIHQPLHASDDDDQGGNCEHLQPPLRHADGTRTNVLHGAWDVDEVLAVMKVLGKEEATAAVLFQRFKNGARVPQATVLEWTRESNQLARENIYQKLRIPQYTAPIGKCAANVQPLAIGQAYLDSNEKLVEQQLMRAGIRLSNVLNEICAGNGCQVPRGSQMDVNGRE